MPELSSLEGQPVQASRDADSFYRSGASFVSAGSINATVVKASAGRLYSVDFHNFNAAARVIKIYDKATAPVPGSDTPVLVIPLAATAGASRTWPGGLPFANGISFVAVTGATLTDATAVSANDIVGKIGFL